MAHEEIHEENLTHEEIKYRYHIQRGYDFTRIELFRSARENYREALKYKPGDAFASEKAEECDRNIRRDTLRVLIIVPIVLSIVAAVVYFSLR